MPQTINGSTNIATLDLLAIADLCQGKFFLSVSPSTYISNGEAEVQGATFKVVSPAGVVIKDYSDTPDVAPNVSGSLDAFVAVNVPTIAGNYQYGKYTISAKLIDEDGTAYEIEKTITICEPDANNPNRKYGTAYATLKGVCKDGKIYVTVNQLPVYRGKESESQVNSFTFYYPNTSGLDSFNTTVTQFSARLFEGVYKLEGTICGSYNLGDNLYVKINYKLKVEKDQKCIVDLCCVHTQLQALSDNLKSDCTDDEKVNTSNTIVEALFYLQLATSAAECGNDPSDAVNNLERILGCSCTCACNEGQPILSSTPSNDVVIEGCGFTSQTNGLTTTYTLYNHSYSVSVTSNGGALVVSPPQFDGCNKYQTFSFDIDVVYNQIKNLADASNTEAKFWASVIRKTLAGLDASCLGLNAQQYAQLSLAGIFQALFSKFCECCGCTAEISGLRWAQLGLFLVIKWDENTTVESVDVYVDGQLRGNVLAGIKEFYYGLNPRVEEQHTIKLVAKCSNGALGNMISGITDAMRKAVFIPPPSVYDSSIVNNCPFNLNANVADLPIGYFTEWHTQANTNSLTLVPNPEQALQGVYYGYSTDGEGNYSETPVQVTLVCQASTSFSAPQNLNVFPSSSTGSVVQFQSAAYPPPNGSYTVKRRLKSDSDISGNYITIGSPVWNSAAKRWTINDPSAAKNVLYVYRAISNAPDGTPYVDFDYADITCPTVTLTPEMDVLHYSFNHVGGQVDKYLVSIFNVNESTPFHTDTHNTLPFPSPITGTFAYLDPNKQYAVMVTPFITTKFKDCPVNYATTYNDQVDLTIDYIGGQWSAVLSDKLPANLIVGNGTQQAIGSDQSNCGNEVQADFLPQLTIEAGKTSKYARTNGLSYITTYYHIQDGLYIDYLATTKNDGETFVFHGVTITVHINRLNCTFYPA